VTQGHRQCHNSIERVRLRIRLSQKLCVYLVPFSRYSQFLSKVADFNSPRLHLAPPRGLIPVEFRGDMAYFNVPTGTDVLGDLKSVLEGLVTRA